MYALCIVCCVYAFTSPQSVISTRVAGLPFCEPCASIAFTTSIPSTTLPVLQIEVSLTKIKDYKEINYQRHSVCRPTKVFLLLWWKIVSRWCLVRHSPSTTDREFHAKKKNIGCKYKRERKRNTFYFQFEVLICKSVAVYWGSSSAIVIRKVTALNHLCVFVFCTKKKN